VFDCSQLCNLLTARFAYGVLLLEEDVLLHVLTLLSHASSHQLFGRSDSVSRRSSSLGERVGDEVASSRINILDGHKLLVEDNLLCNVRTLNSTDAPNVFQND
jgi:hypothetical protein